ncbi:LPKTxAVK-anchored surface protein [Streptococcus parasanguinis]
MKKVLLSSVAALAIFAAATPVFAERQLSDAEKASTQGTNVQANPYDKNSEGHATSSIPEVRVGVHYGRVNVVTPDGKPLAGVPVDVLVNGKVVLDSVPTNEGGFVEFEAPAGATVLYRDAVRPKGYFLVSTGTSFIVSGDQMYTDGTIVLSNAKAPDQTVTPGSDNGSTNGATNEAKKTEEGAKAAQNGKASSAQAGKALPKTSAVK